MASPPLALLLLPLILASVVLSSPLYEPARFEFEIFKSKYGKSYNSDEEHDHRFNVFSQHLEKIEEHNNDPNKRFKLGVNSFSDLTFNEFKSQRLINMSSFRTASSPKLHVAVNAKNLPDSFDWVDYGVVQKIKDQGKCGSCWAFSAISVIESSWAIANKTLYSLSEQQLVSCEKADHGCNGGLPIDAFDYFKQTNVCSEKLYPYHANDEECVMSNLTPDTPVKVVDYFHVKKNVDEIKHALVERGPLSIAITVQSDFMSVGSDGIYDSDDCLNDEDSLNHAVVIVGYGSMTRDDGSVFNYWKVRNSWSMGWGDDGYVKMAIKFDEAGLCGMYHDVFYPTVVSLQSAN